MSYFLAIPLFLLAVACMVGIALLTFFVPAMRTTIYPFAWRILLWSCAGFFSANLLLWLSIIGLTKLQSNGAESTLLTAATVFLAMAGPLIASLVGLGKVCITPCGLRWHGIGQSTALLFLPIARY